MPNNMAMGLCTGCRKRGDASKKERCTCFKSERSTIIAVLSSFAAVDGGAAAPAAAAESVRCVALVGVLVLRPALAMPLTLLVLHTEFHMEELALPLPTLLWLWELP